MPGTLKKEKITTANGSDLRQLEIQYNELTKTVAAMQSGMTGNQVLTWYGVGPNSGTSPMKIGSTDTRVGTAACLFTILGVPVVKAVSDAGTAFAASGTIPASTWGIIAIDVVAAGTVTYVEGAANYTTGYASEAAAIAALPAQVTVKARMGYITILASASGWVQATDALAGGSSGNPATTTNYYPVDGVCTPTGLVYGPNGASAGQVAYLPSALGLSSVGNAWTNGKNGVVVGAALAIGSTDTRVANGAFIYNANGLTNIPKAAVAAGTALGALGTIPADQWGILAVIIDGAGTITYASGPANYTTGYKNEGAALGDMNKIAVADGKCLMGVVTVKTKAATAWIAGTDAFAGGASGNPASATNYYSTPAFTLGTGVSASLIANREGTVLSSSQY